MFYTFSIFKVFFLTMYLSCFNHFLLFLKHFCFFFFPFSSSLITLSQFRSFLEVVFVFFSSCFHSFQTNSNRSFSESHYRWTKEQMLRGPAGGNIIRKYSNSFTLYADDAQIYLSVKPDETKQLLKEETCLKDIKLWLRFNFVLLKHKSFYEHIREMNDLNSIETVSCSLTGSHFHQDLSANSTFSRLQG